MSCLGDVHKVSLNLILHQTHQFVYVEEQEDMQIMMMLLLPKNIKYLYYDKDVDTNYLDFVFDFKISPHSLFSGSDWYLE